MTKDSADHFFTYKKKVDFHTFNINVFLGDFNKNTNVLTTTMD